MAESEHLHQFSLLETRRLLPHLRDALPHVPHQQTESAFEKLKREGRCRLCGVEGGPVPNNSFLEQLLDDHDGRFVVLTKHHLVSQSAALWRRNRGRKHSGPNIVPLCRPCHDNVEADADVRARLRTLLQPDELDFVAEIKGVEWLDERYPGEESNQRSRQESA